MNMMESSLGTMRWELLKNTIIDTKLDSALEARQKIKEARKTEVFKPTPPPPELQYFFRNFVTLLWNYYMMWTQAATLDTITEGVLKEHMGLLYFLLPWRREQVRRRLKIAAAVEQEMDAIQVPTHGNYGKENDFVYEFTDAWMVSCRRVLWRPMATEERWPSPAPHFYDSSWMP
jgi:hypothetical protein